MNGKFDGVDGIGPATVGVGTAKRLVPLGPARGASRNPQARARHNEASQRPPTTEVTHRTHDAILEMTTQTRRSHVVTYNVISGAPPAGCSAERDVVLAHAVWVQADRPRPTPAQRRPHRHVSLNTY